MTGKWERNNLVVTFKKDDKSVYRRVNIKYEDSIENENSELVHKNADKYNNYEFQGWFKCQTDDCDSYDSMPYNFAEDGKKVTSNLTLIAVYKQVVNTMAIMSDFTSNLSSKDFSAYDAGENNIIFNVINSDAKLNGDNFDTFVEAMNNLLRVKNVKSVEIRYSTDSVELKNIDIRSQLQTLITTLSKKGFSEGKMTDLLTATFTIKITLNDNFKNPEDKDNVTYTVKFASDKFVLVSSEDDLNRELTSGKEIIIEKSFAINKVIKITDNVVIDGDGNEITSNIKDSKYAINITGGNVTIKDLTLNINVYLPSEYDKENNKPKDDENRNTIGIYVGEDTTLTISKLTVNGGKSVDKNNLKIGDEFYSSTNIAINVNAAIELRGTLKGSSLTYTTEIYGSPAILIPKEASVKVNIGGVHHQKYIYSFTRKNELTDSIDSYKPIEDYEHYYVDYDSSYFTLAWYVMPNNKKFMFFYLYNEYLILPEAFKETGSNYTYIEDGKTYELKTWNIKDGNQGITSDQLIQEQVKNNNTYYIYGNYPQKN